MEDTRSGVTKHSTGRRLGSIIEWPMRNEMGEGDKIKAKS